MRSATIGLRLCGIADEPFWPLPNGSCTSRTSVRARWRISVANRSSDDGDERERGEQLGVPVARDDLRRDGLRLEAEPLAGDPLDLGVGHRVRADRARELADAHARRARGAAARAPRSSSNAQPASFSPKVVGSAWTPCVRPMQSVCRCSSARADRPRPAPARPPRAAARRRPGAAARARCRPRPTRSGRSGASGPRRRAPPATASTKAARSWFVSRSISATRSGVGVTAVARIASAASPRHDAELGPGVERGELDLEPARELPLVRPDLGHGGTGVARDHSDRQ